MGSTVFSGPVQSFAGYQDVRLNSAGQKIIVGGGPISGIPVSTGGIMGTCKAYSGFTQALPTFGDALTITTMIIDIAGLPNNTTDAGIIAGTGLEGQLCRLDVGAGKLMGEILFAEILCAEAPTAAQGVNNNLTLSKNTILYNGGDALAGGDTSTLAEGTGTDGAWVTGDAIIIDKSKLLDEEYVYFANNATAETTASGVFTGGIFEILIYSKAM